jgi:hypothetical protein
VLGGVCADVARAYVSFGGATGNMMLSVLGDAKRSGVGGALVSLSMLSDAISVSIGSVADGASSSRASVAAAFHLQNAARRVIAQREAMR